MPSHGFEMISLNRSELFVVTEDEGRGLFPAVNRETGFPLTEMVSWVRIMASFEG